MKTGVVMDSTINLPIELEGAFLLERVPLNVVIDGVNYQDQVDITGDDVMKALIENKKVTTSQPSPELFVKAYQNLIDAGCEHIMCVTISGGLSGTKQSAEIAIDLLENKEVEIEIIDSLSTGMVGDCLMGEYMDQKDRFSTFKELAQHMVSIAKQIKTALSVDDLRYLIRSGRLTKTQAIIGNLLKVKPIIEVLDDGKLELAEKVRSTKKVMTYFLDQLAESAKGSKKLIVSIAGIQAKERIQELGALIEEQFEHVKIYYSKDITPVVATHIGIGGIGISWFTK